MQEKFVARTNFPALRSLPWNTNSSKKSVRPVTLDGTIRGAPVNGGSKQSEAPEHSAAEDSKSIRPGRPVKRIVRAVLHDLGLLGRM